ncbi:hypothetical protein [Streptomyces sp. NPDC053079]|uniref:hypothetical protein n=1 Tax=Streptomyces sp. NPDC053079 TaxID=3365697 RepID=UPI0037CF9DFF
MHAIAAIALAVFLIAVGIAHFLIPDHFRALVPQWLGQADPWVAATGAAEIFVGALVLMPWGRSAGGWAAAVLITAYLVSHVDALWHARSDRPGVLERPLGAVARLLVNVLYIGWAAAVALTAP